MDKITYINKAKEIHGNKYNYDLLPISFKGTDKIPILCNIHGEFYQIARNHVYGIHTGCPKCGRLNANKSLCDSFEMFVEKARKVHKNNYEYLKGSFAKTSSKLQIKCNKCGNVFMQKGSMHLIGHGCPICNHAPTILNTEIFRERLSRTHPNLFLLSNYKGSNGIVKVRCKIHNHIFDTTPHRLQYGNNCQKCYDERRGNVLRKSIGQLTIELNEVHGNKYEYPYIEKEYKNNKSKITVLCKKHGEFKSTINKLLIGQGCPICKESHLEKSIFKILNEIGVNSIRQKKFDWLKNDRTNLPLSLDFYLPDYNIAIECQGEQHFRPTKNFGGIYCFEKTKYRDNIKHRLCNENGIKIIYILVRKSNRFLINEEFNGIYNENTYFIEDIMFNKEIFKKIINYL